MPEESTRGSTTKTRPTKNYTTATQNTTATTDKAAHGSYSDNETISGDEDGEISGDGCLGSDSLEISEGSSSPFEEIHGFPSCSRGQPSVSTFISSTTARGSEGLERPRDRARVGEGDASVAIGFPCGDGLRRKSPPICKSAIKTQSEGVGPQTTGLDTDGCTDDYVAGRVAPNAEQSRRRPDCAGGPMGAPVGRHLAHRDPQRAGDPDPVGDITSVHNGAREDGAHYGALHSAFATGWFGGGDPPTGDRKEETVSIPVGARADEHRLGGPVRGEEDEGTEACVSPGAQQNAATRDPLRTCVERLHTGTNSTAIAPSGKRDVGVLLRSGGARHNLSENTTRDGARRRKDAAARKYVRRLLGRAIAGLPSGLKTQCTDREALYDLPLHVKDVPRLSWERAMGMILPELTENFLKCKRMLTDPGTLEEASAVAAKNGWCHKAAEAELSERDLALLLAHDYIEPTTSEQVRGTLKIFTLPEKQGTRRRLILVPKIFNRVLVDPGEITLPSVEDVAADVLLPFAICGDFAAWYIHFSLPLDARKFYCFPFRGSWYRSTVLCTGQRQCPALAHALTFSLASRAALAANGSVRVRAYIDNIRFAGSDGDCWKAWAAALDLAAALPAKLELQSAGAEYVFLGVHCVHSMPAATRMAEKSITKLRDLGAYCLNRENDVTFRHWLSLLGILMWSARVAAQPKPALMYPLLKFIRRKCATTSLNEIATLWPSVEASAKAWVTHALTNHHREVHPDKLGHANVVLISDASLEGWCSIILEGTKVRVVYGPFAPRLRTKGIAALEALATLFGAMRLEESSSPRTLLCIVDNTSWCGALRKGRSSAHYLNQVLNKLCEVLASKNIKFWKHHWIDSFSNPADAFTRLGVHSIGLVEFNSVSLLHAWASRKGDGGLICVPE